MVDMVEPFSSREPLDRVDGKPEVRAALSRVRLSGSTLASLSIWSAPNCSSERFS